MRISLWIFFCSFEEYVLRTVRVHLTRMQTRVAYPIQRIKINRLCKQVLSVPGHHNAVEHAHRNWVVQGLLLLRILSYVRRRSCPIIIPSLRPLAPWAHDPLLVELCYLVGCRNTPRDRSSKCFAFAYFRRKISQLNRGHDLSAPFSTPQLGREFLI